MVLNNVDEILNTVASRLDIGNRIQAKPCSEQLIETANLHVIELPSLAQAQEFIRLTMQETKPPKEAGDQGHIPYLMQVKGDPHIPKLGVIGGMGPDATRYFLSLLEDKNFRGSVDICLVPHTPDRTQAILNPGPNNSVIETIFKESYQLMSDSQSIVIPCNTAHYFSGSISSLIHMPNLAIQTLTSRKGPNTTLLSLATAGTNKTDIYRAPCLEYGCELILPNNDQQRLTDRIIYEDIKRPGSVTDRAREGFVSLVTELLSTHKQLDAIGLFCTELPLVAFDKKARHELEPLLAQFGKTMESFFVDPMTVVAELVAEKR